MTCNYHDNTAYAQGKVHSKIRRSVLETIYSKVSADGKINLDPVTEPINYVCNVDGCGLPFRLSDKEELIRHLHDDHMISRAEAKGHYRVNMKTVGYCVPDEEFAKTMKKYGVIDKNMEIPHPSNQSLKEYLNNRLEELFLKNTDVNITKVAKPIIHDIETGIITNFRKLEQKIIIEYVNYVKSI